MPTTRRKFAVPAVVAALFGAVVAVAPPASAALPIRLPAACTSTAGDTVGQQNPDNPDAVDFSGTGTIDCVLGVNLTMHGVSTFSGTLPRGECTGINEGLIYRAKVAWDDGTFTTGTFTDFRQTTLDGTAAVLISGITDTSSTKYPGYKNLLVSTSLGECGTPSDESEKVQAGTVLYLP